jgi:Fe2+ or Zn2+ uptake regulation protein
MTSIDMKPAYAPDALLKSHGLHVTSQRLAILKAVNLNPHSTAEEISDSARETTSSLSRQVVFDTLNTFTEKGIIRRIQPAASAARYEDRIDDNHHHIVCRTCGMTQDVDCAVGYRPCLEAEHDHGFSIEEAEVIYWGTCPDCKKSETKKGR